MQMVADWTFLLLTLVLSLAAAEPRQLEVDANECTAAMAHIILRSGEPMSHSWWKTSSQAKDIWRPRNPAHGGFHLTIDKQLNGERQNPHVTLRVDGPPQVKCGTVVFEPRNGPQKCLWNALNEVTAICNRAECDIGDLRAACVTHGQAAVNLYYRCQSRRLAESNRCMSVSACPMGNCPGLGRAFDLRSRDLSGTITGGRRILKAEPLLAWDAKYTPSKKRISHLKHQLSLKSTVEASIARFGISGSTMLENAETMSGFLKFTSGKDVSEMSSYASAFLEEGKISGTVDLEFDKAFSSTAVLTDTFKQDFQDLPVVIEKPDSEESWDKYFRFLTKYGTHIMVKQELGSLVTQWTSTSIKKEDLHKAMKARLCASVEGVDPVSWIRGCAGYSKENRQSSLDISAQDSLIILGGTKVGRDAVHMGVSKESIATFIQEAEVADQPAKYGFKEIWTVLMDVYDSCSTAAGFAEDRTGYCGPRQDGSNLCVSPTSSPVCDGQMDEFGFFTACDLACAKAKCAQEPRCMGFTRGQDGKVKLKSKIQWTTAHPATSCFRKVPGSQTAGCQDVQRLLNLEAAYGFQASDCKPLKDPAGHSYQSFQMQNPDAIISSQRYQCWAQKTGCISNAGCHLGGAGTVCYCYGGGCLKEGEMMLNGMYRTQPFGVQSGSFNEGPSVSCEYDGFFGCDCDDDDHFAGRHSARYLWEQSHSRRLAEVSDTLLV